MLYRYRLRDRYICVFCLCITIIIYASLRDCSRNRISYDNTYSGVPGNSTYIKVAKYFSLITRGEKTEKTYTKVKPIISDVSTARNFTSLIRAKKDEIGSTYSGVKLRHSTVKTTGICTSVLKGEENGINDALKYMASHKRLQPSDKDIVTITKDCESLKRSMLPPHDVSEEEINFPIAYSILLHENVFEAIRLLSAIYRPHNIYCLHVDNTSSPNTLGAVYGLSSCLQHVYVATKLENVIYSGYTRLQAELNCMGDMLKQDVPWKYYINLVSRMFPLKTNAEIVKILTVYNGANDIEGITEPHRMYPDRFTYKIKYAKQPNHAKPIMLTTKDKLGTIPHGIKLVKGSAYGVFSRGFVKFALQDKKAKDFLEWTEAIRSPDEYFWATLNHNPHLKPPGGYAGKPDSKPWLATFVQWIGSGPCKGKNVRNVCVLGVGDIHRLVSRKELFVNKLYSNFQYLALDCLEEWLYNRTENPSPLNISYYQSLPFINKTRVSSGYLRGVLPSVEVPLRRQNRVSSNHRR